MQLRMGIMWWSWATWIGELVIESEKERDDRSIWGRWRSENGERIWMKWKVKTMAIEEASVLRGRCVLWILSSSTGIYTNARKLLYVITWNGGVWLIWFEWETIFWKICKSMTRSLLRMGGGMSNLMVVLFKLKRVCGWLKKAGRR